MKIVFQKVVEWEGKPHAEAELAIRMLRAASSIESLNAIASSDLEEIASFNPDVVVPLHFFIPKLFDAFTVGCMWNPIEAIKQNDAWDNIKSYDGYGVASEHQSQMVKALKFRSPSPYLLSTIYPSTNTTDFIKPEIFKQPVYIGSNWCGNRHLELFSSSNNIHVYGPRNSWASLNESTYRGEIPFDGESALRIYHDAGIGLSLHHGDHNHDGLPSMRPFEIAASCAVMISDQNEFVQKAFGGNSLYVDVTLQADEIAEQIEEHTNWIKGHVNQAQEMAKACHDIFVNKFSLEVLLQNLINDIESNHSNETFTTLTDAPDVEIIVRTDGADRKKLFRALSSINKQTYQNVIALIVYRGSPEGLLSLKEWAIENLPNLKIRYVCEYAESDRCTQFYTGLRLSKAKLTGFLDYDDILFSDHVETLVLILERESDVALAYSGSVQAWEGGESPQDEEARRLAYFFEINKKTGFQYCITSNSYLVRKDMIPWSLLNQPIPKLDSAEDAIFLSALFDASMRFVFSEKVTSLFFWRSTKDDNTAFDTYGRREIKKARDLVLQPSSTILKYWVERPTVLNEKKNVTREPLITFSSYIKRIARKVMMKIKRL